MALKGFIDVLKKTATDECVMAYQTGVLSSTLKAEFRDQGGSGRREWQDAIDVGWLTGTGAGDAAVTANELAAFTKPEDLVGLVVADRSGAQEPYTVALTRYVPSSSAIAAARRANIKQLVRLQIGVMPLALEFGKDEDIATARTVLHGFIRKTLAALDTDSNLTDNTRHDYIEENAKVDIAHFAAYRGTVGNTELITEGAGALNVFYVVARSGSPPVYTATAQTSIVMPALATIDAKDVPRAMYE